MVTQSRLKELFNYDPLTGVFTRTRKLSGGNGKKGAIAGCLHHSGYWRMVVDHVRYAAHRLAWIYMYGYDSPLFIDHVNQVKTDNRIVNLREATPSQNNCNTHARADNKLGVKGVERSGKGFRAHIVIAGKKKHLGSFKCATAAALAYAKAAGQANGEFASL